MSDAFSRGRQKARAGKRPARHQRAERDLELRVIAIAKVARDVFKIDLDCARE